MKPASITDIAVATSIFRPGPLSLKVDQRFLNNRANPDSVVYKHPLQAEIFKETSGCLAGDSLITTSSGELRIDEIVSKQLIGTEVLSLNEKTGELEPDTIVAAVQTGIKETYIITTEDGDIELTEDHIVYTTKGQKMVKNLTENDIMLSLNL
jgi:hypothetical protein